MIKYSTALSKSSRKFLKKTDKLTKERILSALVNLSIEPYTYIGSEPIAGLVDVYRIRVGKYRVIYQIKDDILVIAVIDIDSRGDIYKRI